MELANADKAANPRPDRRAAHRYPIATPLKYKTLVASGEAAGLGLTIDMSNASVLIQTSRPLTNGARVELSIAWPALLDERVPLTLHIIGRAVRTEGDYSAITIERHEFRTSGLRREGGIEVQGTHDA